MFMKTDIKMLMGKYINVQNWAMKSKGRRRRQCSKVEGVELPIGVGESVTWLLVLCTCPYLNDRQHILWLNIHSIHSLNFTPQTIPEFKTINWISIQNRKWNNVSIMTNEIKHSIHYIMQALIHFKRNQNQSDRHSISIQS